MTKPSNPDLAQTSGVKFPPPLIFIIGFALGLLLQQLVPVSLFANAAARLLSAVCLCASLLLSFSSLFLFWRARTSPLPIKPTTAIVTNGPYRFTRNPMYLSLILLYISLALWFDLFGPFVLLPAVIVIVRYYVIAREERYLEQKFGVVYLNYKSRVRRWL